VAIVGSLFAMVGRFAGRLLNSALGWATILLFGKVAGSKQTLLLVIALGSLAWVLVVLSIAFPDLGTFLLAFVPVPDFVDENLVRLAMLGLALLIPLLIGIAAFFVSEASQRQKGLGLVTGVLRGYPFTLILALTIVILAVVSLVRKARSLTKRWEDAHVPVVVKPGGYDQVLDQLHEVLDEAGLDVEPKPAPAVLSLPPRLLDAVAGKALGGLVPDRLMLLAGRDLEVLVYPSDVAIAGSKEAVARSRAAIAAELTTAPAYLTTSAESERIEDAIRDVTSSGRPDRGAALPQLRDRLQGLDGKIARLTVPFDEWETVYRQRLQVERDVLAREVEYLSSRGSATSATRRSEPPILERVVAWAGLALVALDVALLIADRFAPRSSRSP
jgi:hypothetical protein